MKNKKISKKNGILMMVIIGLMLLLNIQVNANNEVLIFVDSPIISATKDGTLEINGWIMSETPNKKVNIYIDNALQLAPTRIERADVLSVIKGYGTSEQNPLPGYSLEIDTTSISLGTHSLKIEVLDESNNIIGIMEKNFELEPVKTTLFLDTPDQEVKKGELIEISGWVMSESENKKVETYIDGNLINGVTYHERTDVLNVIKGYGTIEQNPTPGFSVYHDTSTMSIGSHKLEMKVIDTITNEILHTTTKDIIVKSYDATIFLDTPTKTINKEEKIEVSGWYLSNCTNKRIEVLVNGILQTGITYTNRDDVLNVVKNFGTNEENPTPGFKLFIDSTKLPSGKNDLEIRVIDNSNEDILHTLTKEINVEEYIATSFLDEPTKSIDKENEATISGWYLSNAKNKRVEVYIDNILQQAPIYSKRDDVLKVIKIFGTEEENPNPGFTTTFDPTKFESGEHEIKILVIDNLTEEILSENNYNFTINNYKTKSHIEYPSYYVEGTHLNIEGWIMSETKNKELQIYVDNNKIENYTLNERNDVIEAIKDYGTELENPTPGFKTEIDISNYTDGIHNLTIELKDTVTGEIIYQKTNQFDLEKYQGIIFIDSPVGANYNGEINVSGWEMSEYPNSYVKILYNGKELTTTVTRQERSDVLAAVKDYGDQTINPTPGFTTTINTSTLPEGRGELKVELYTSLNEKIYETSKEINIYHNVSFGIDVSKYQTSVNWPQVKAYGIDYAFVRVGFRGYGSGLIGGDQYFKSHVIGASTSGLDVGIYFFSQAINTHEAIEEANYSIDMMHSQGLTQYVNLPIVIDTEYSGASNNSGRADNLTVQQRTDIVRAFVDTVRQRGYEPMIYASKSFLYGNLDMTQLSDIDVWLAHYTAHPAENPDPFSYPTNYNGIYDYWQYTSKGYVNGINGYVDMNLGY